MVLFLTICVIVLLIATIVVAYLFYRLKKNSKSAINVIAEEKIELKSELHKVDEKNSDFESSVQYAKRLVDAIFKIGELVQFDQLEYFLLYNPKDIISGDFIWHNSKYDRHYFVVADCTGHGVPGAFMSIISHNLFSQAVNELGYNKPSDILSFVNKRHYEIFNSNSKSNIKDGMDVAVCVIDTDAEVIEFAGAMRPIHLLRSNGKLEQINGDRMSIGHDSYSFTQKFTDHIIDFLPGDTVYLSTDGFVDQFGGPSDKKFKPARFRKTITNFMDMDTEEQLESLLKTFNNWKGDTAQIDDVTVLGIKYSEL